MAELFPQRLRRLRKEKNLSPEHLAALTVKDGKFGISAQRIRQQEQEHGVVPTADKLEVLAEALGVDASEFYEYPIAVARRDAAASPEAVQKRMADRLRKQAQREAARRGESSDTTPTPKRRKGQAP